MALHEVNEDRTSPLKRSIGEIISRVYTVKMSKLEGNEKNEGNLTGDGWQGNDSSAVNNGLHHCRIYSRSTSRALPRLRSFPCRRS